MAKILISYRQSDTSAQGSVIQDLLVQHFGGEMVALDQPAAVALDAESRLGGDDALVVLIGATWLTRESGGNPLDDEDDPVAGLLRSAMARQVMILPVLVNDTEMPAVEQLGPFSSLTFLTPHIFSDRETGAEGASVDSLIGSIEEHWTKRNFKWRPDRGIDDKNWQLLTNAIEDGRVVPILGSGLSPDVVALRARLAQKWAREYGYEIPEGLRSEALDTTGSDTALVDGWAKEFARVFQYVTVEWDRYEPYKWFRDGLLELAPTDFEDERNPYNVLAGLPIPLFLTTNQASHLELALQTKLRDHKSLHYRRPRMTDVTYEHAPPLNDPSYIPTKVEPVVYHLYGSLEDQDPTRMTLSEDDYLSFLYGVANERTTLPKSITKALGDNKQLLILGFEWNDLAFRTLLRGLLPLIGMGIDKQTSVAVQLEASADSSMIDYVQRYFDRFNFNVYLGKPQEFTEDLVERLESART